jgi:small subunit ribosomal protein S20
MANTKSSIKRIKTNERRRVENAPYKSLVKTFMKKYFFALEGYKVDKSDEKYNEVKLLLNLAYGKIDKAKKKNIFHANTASRKKSRLGRALTKIQQSN